MSEQAEERTAREGRCLGCDSGMEVGIGIHTCNTAERAVIATFHLNSRGKYELFEVYTKEPKYESLTGYSVDWCRRDEAYYFHLSSGGTQKPVAVSGPYWCASSDLVKEERCNLVDRAARLRNKTRRLLTQPRHLGTGDLFEWLEQNAMDDSTNYCSVCRDYLPDSDPCKHIWWCEELCAWSMPGERLDCKCEDCTPEAAEKSERKYEAHTA